MKANKIFTVFVTLLLSLSVLASESSTNRQNKRFQIVASYGGDYSSGAVGVFGGYFLDRDKLLGVGISKYSSSFVEGTGIQVLYKSYVGNSFYWQPTLSYRNAGHVDDDFFGLGERTRTDDFRDLSLGFKIGNQWQWDSFTLGCDWVGISGVFSNLGGSKKESYSSDSHVTLLNLYLGVSF